MNRTASLVAAGGLITAAICLPLAGFLHRDDARPARWESVMGDWFGEEQNLSEGPGVLRDFSWDGSDRAELDGSGDLHFHPSPTWHLTIRGPAGTLDRLRVQDGHIGLKSSGFFHWDHPGRLDVQLSGPALRQIGVNGSGNITLDEVNQDGLTIRIRGSGAAVAQGSVNALRLEIAGSGHAQLAGLAAKDACVSIAGSGDADIAPADSADVSIAGSGDVRLHTSPGRVSSHVSGSGHVINLGSSPPPH
jgi:hypothetical protein